MRAGHLVGAGDIRCPALCVCDGREREAESVALGVGKEQTCFARFYFWPELLPPGPANGLALGCGASTRWAGAVLFSFFPPLRIFFITRF